MLRGQFEIGVCARGAGQDALVCCRCCCKMFSFVSTGSAVPARTGYIAEAALLLRVLCLRSVQSWWPRADSLLYLILLRYSWLGDLDLRLQPNAVR